MREVKDYLGNELNKFILANIIIVLLLSGRLDVLSDAKTITVFGISLANIGIVASPMYVYIFVLNYIYSPWLKSKLVFLWCNMPGCTIFSDIKNCITNDPRFTKKDVMKYYADVYSAIECYDPCEEKDKILKYENSSWYKIYRKYKEDAAVRDAMRGQLLCRDACVATVSMILLLVIMSILGYGWFFNCKSFLFLIFVYILSNIAARLRAKRLVLTVIAVDIATIKNTSGMKLNE